MPYQQTFDPVPAQFERFTELLRSLTPDEQQARVPGMDWTAAEVGTHVLTVLRRYLSVTERAVTRERLAMLNAEEIAAIPKTPQEVADDIDGIIEGLTALAGAVPLDAERSFHLGMTVTVAAGWANLIGETFVHGHDIARATGRNWTMDGSLLEGIWRNLLPAAAGWMRAEARALTELYHLRFAFGLVTLRLDNGNVVVDDPVDATRTPDHSIIVKDAASFTLEFPYRRSVITDPTTALLASRFIDI